MAPHLSENLSVEGQLALAHTPVIMKEALRVFLEFDARLARIVSGTNEMMLGQIRLAWWRDSLSLAVSERPAGDQVLDAIGVHWQGAEAALIALIDGWEHMLSEPPLSREAAMAFAKGRGAGLAGMVTLMRTQDRTKLSDRESVEANVQAAIQAVGEMWALADAASHVAEDGERAILLNLAAELPALQRLSAPYCGVAVLGALAARAVKAGGAPLMAGRGAALTAMRAGLLGR